MAELVDGETEEEKELPDPQPTPEPLLEAPAVSDPTAHRPAPTAIDTEDVEAKIRRKVGTDAEETFAVILEMLRTKPTRALNLIETYTKALRTLLVEVMEPEEELDANRAEEDGRRRRDDQLLVGAGGVRIGRAGPGRAWRNGVLVDNNPYAPYVPGPGLGAGTNVVGQNVGFGLFGQNPAGQPNGGRLGQRGMWATDANGDQAVAMESIRHMVVTNVNGLVYAIMAARGLGNEEFMETLRNELGRVMVLDGAQGEATTHVATVPLEEILPSLDVPFGTDEDLDLVDADELFGDEGEDESDYEDGGDEDDEAGWVVHGRRRLQRAAEMEERIAWDAVPTDGIDPAALVADTPMWAGADANEIVAVVDRRGRRHFVRRQDVGAPWMRGCRVVLPEDDPLFALVG